MKIWKNVRGKKWKRYGISMGNTNLNSGGIVTIYIPAMRVLEYSAKASLVQGKK